MKKIFKVVAQSETFFVPSQKAEGGQISKCNIVLQDIVVNEIIKINN